MPSQDREMLFLNVVTIHMKGFPCALYQKRGSSWIHTKNHGNLVFYWMLVNLPGIQYLWFNRIILWRKPSNFFLCGSMPAIMYWKRHVLKALTFKTQLNAHWEVETVTKGLSLPKWYKEEITAAWVFFWKTCHSLFMEQYFLIAVPLETKCTIALFIFSTKRFVLTLLQGVWLLTSDIPSEKLILDLPCSMF